MEETKENYDAIAIEESVKEEIREEYEELRLSIDKLSSKIGKLFSYSQTFLRGIVQGVGIALGSGVVFVILSALLYQTFSYLGFGSEIKDLLPVKTLPGEVYRK
jgi:hypothetical protein